MDRRILKVEEVIKINIEIKIHKVIRIDEMIETEWRNYGYKDQ